MSKLSPFDFVKSINSTKQYLMEDSDAEKAYVPWIVNKALSHFPDTVFLANAMNRYPELPNKLQYDFLINIVYQRHRYAPWNKKEDDNVLVIQEHYKCNKMIAKQILEVLSEEQFITIKQMLDKGGE